jgi:hypothetical protein
MSGESTELETWVDEFKTKNGSWFKCSLESKQTYKLKGYILVYDVSEMKLGMKTIEIESATLLNSARVRLNGCPWNYFKDKPQFFKMLQKTTTTENIHVLKRWLETARAFLGIPDYTNIHISNSEEMYDVIEYFTIHTNLEPLGTIIIHNKYTDETITHEACIFLETQKDNVKTINSAQDILDFLQTLKSKHAPMNKALDMSTLIHTDHPSSVYVNGWNWKRSFMELQREQNCLHETSDITVLESWMRELTSYTLTEKWTTGDSHRLVYDIGKTQNLEVHSAFFIELDGRPMMVPACVVYSGQTDFEFFDTKKGLFQALGENNSSGGDYETKGHSPAALPDIENIKVIRGWVNEFASDNKHIKIEEVSRKDINFLNYNVVDSIQQSRTININPAKDNRDAFVRFAHEFELKTFTDKTSLHDNLTTMLSPE